METELPIVPSTEGVRGRVLRFAEAAAGAAASYHRARLIGAENLPGGPGMLVGNHGLYGYETPVFFWLIKQATGRYPLGLAERGFFKIPVVRTVLPWLGGVRGTRSNAVAALRGGQLVVCYPGGAYETFKRRAARYTLRWERTCGFVRCAAEAGVPIVPFAGFGVDDAFKLEAERLSLKLADDEKYHVPLRLPVPMPAAFSFAIGEPMWPPPPDAPQPTVERFKDRVARSVRRLLVQACHA